jgi:hypothetical protein
MLAAAVKSPAFPTMSRPTAIGGSISDLFVYNRGTGGRTNKPEQAEDTAKDFDNKDFDE